jgi:predicted metal-dependent HD superfamily phosphohydrolase
MKKVFLTIIILGFSSLLSIPSFAQITKLKDIVANGPNGRVPQDGFSSFVAISENIAVVGASKHDFNAYGTDSLNDAGAAYVFYKDEGGINNWGLIKILTGLGVNGRVSYDNFGISGAIDGDIIVIGAIEQDYDENGVNNKSGAGAAYVFQKDKGGTNNWGIVKKLVGKGLNGRNNEDFFGISVGVSNNTIVVGARDHDFDANGNNNINNAGAAFIYQKDEGGLNNWGQVKKIVANGTNSRNKDDNFGQRVAIDEDIIVVGATSHDFDENGLNDVSNAGAAFIYQKDQGGANNWGLVKKVVGGSTSGRVISEFFGDAISISRNTLVIGAQGQTFDTTGLNSLSNAGAAYVFSKNEGGVNNWGLTKMLIGTGVNGRNASDRFGKSVSISDNVIAVGSHHGYDDNGTNYITNAGAVFIFTRNEGGANNWGLTTKIVGSGTKGRNFNDVFGSRIAASGSLLFIGIGGQDFDENGNDSLFNAGKVSAYYINPTVTSAKNTQALKAIRISSYKKNVILNFMQNGHYEIHIRDLLGRNLKTKNVSIEVGSIEKISLEGIAQGYYIVTVKDDKHFQSSKVFLY